MGYDFSPHGAGERHLGSIVAMVYKAIKPSTLKIDKMRLELLNEMRTVGRLIKKDFEATTATWKHKPLFEMLISLTQPGPTVLVATDDEIYGYVNFGTRPHPIFAGYYEGRGGSKVLAFPSAFSPKTRPNVIGSGPGSSGGPTVFTPYVQHPGTEPRNFDKIIAAKWQPAFKTHMEQAMRRARQVSGHAI